MIKIDLFVICDGKTKKFYTDENMNFIMSEKDSKDYVILENAGYEFDGLCDDDGNLHFLMQDSDGGLCYIRYTDNVWRKYNIFASKEKKRSISNIKLTESGGVFCAFYIMKHSDKLMLIKHIFSVSNLHMTPQVIDLADFRKDFCICTGIDGNTNLYYRNDKGQRCLKVYDSHFNEIKSEISSHKEDVCALCVVRGKNTLMSLASVARKSYTCLIFKPSCDAKEEKIVTFGIARNAKIAMNVIGERITVFWQEGNRIMYSESSNGGNDFSKPSALHSKTKFIKLRYKGIKPGIYKSEFTTNKFSAGISRFPLAIEHSKYSSSNERRKNVNNNSMRDMDAVEFIHKLSKIEQEAERINRSLDKVCIFLDKIIQFKKDTENAKYSFNTEKVLNTKNDIGEKNEENIKLFENLSIDDALMEKNEISIEHKEISEHEQSI